MSTTEPRGIGDLTAAELVQLRELLAHCPDCRPRVRVGTLSRDGQDPRFVALVEHSPTCPAIPEPMRAAGRTSMLIEEPLLVTLTLRARSQEGLPDDVT